MAFRYDYYVINGALEKEKRLTAKGREAFYGWGLVELDEYEYQILSSVLSSNNSMADCLKELYAFVKSNDIDESSYVKLVKALISQNFFVGIYVED